LGTEGTVINRKAAIAALQIVTLVSVGLMGPSASAAPPKCQGKTATRVGTARADVIKGTAKADVIVGLDGNDSIKGVGGNDTVCGGNGVDLIDGGPGADKLQGDGGNDKLLGSTGGDALNGSAGTDNCLGGGGTNTYLSCEKPTYQLAVSKQGTGDGVVNSTPGAMNCGPVCASSFSVGSEVTLSVLPDPGSRFTGWSDACSGTALTCTVTMDRARSVTAIFDLFVTHPLTVNNDGGGTVTSAPAGISCPGACVQNHEQGTSVTLTATPAAGAQFMGWDGDDCSGTATTCTVTMSQSRTVTAIFGFPLTVIKSGSGQGDVSIEGFDCEGDCSGVYPYGLEIPLTATPNAGSDFGGWSGACTGTGSCAPTMTQARTVIASFTPIQRILTVASGGGGTVTSSTGGISCPGTCSQNYDHGTVVTLTADPAAGGQVLSWSGGGCTGTGTTCAVTMDQARTVTVTFGFPLTVTKDGQGTVTGDGISCGAGCTAVYPYGTNVTLSATGIPSATVFNGWSGDCSGGGTCNVSMVAPRTIGATFSPVQHLLTVDVFNGGGGTITSSPAAIFNCPTTCAAPFDQGSVVTLTAVPAPGAQILGWSGGGCSGTATTCQVTMSDARSVTVTFGFPLTVSKGGAGQGTVSGNGISCGTDCTEVYPYATMVPLSASPDATSTFGGWSGPYCGGTGTCNLSMEGPRTVTATFGLIARSLSVTNLGGGAVTSNPAGISCTGIASDCSETYGQGTVVTLSAAPSPGATFLGWSGGGCTGTSATCTVTLGGVNANVTASFGYPLTVTKSGAGQGTVTGNGISCGADCTEIYSFGTNVPLSAAPNAASSTFDGWSGGGCTGTGGCTVSMTAPRTVGAGFSLILRRLTVNVLNNGGGTVSSSPAGIPSCTFMCSAQFPHGSVVTLTATPSPGGEVISWSGGGCTSGSTTCQVTMNGDQTVTVGFGFPLTVARGGPGNGSISSSPAGVTCPSDCSQLYENGTWVTLTATPDASSVFTGWSEAGCGGTGTCTVTMSQARSVTATFNLATRALNVNNPGGGVVTSAPVGISCPSDCSQTYDHGTVVTLTATPTATGASFMSWSGPCAGSPTASTCVVTMDQARNVTASFGFPVNVSVGGNGQGTIQEGFRIVCPGDCNDVYAFGSNVLLAPFPAANSNFGAWGGDCAGAVGGCSLTMNSPKNVSATFTLKTFTLSVTRNGQGQVSSSPAGITCGFDCSGTYNYGQVVTLSAFGGIDTMFDSWGAGHCDSETDNGDCVVTMTSNRTVSATFVNIE
jgi:hypothetical protein